MKDSLQQSIAATHAALAASIEAAAGAVHTHAERQEIVRKVDAAIISTCQHQSAICHVLIPFARRHFGPGDRRVGEYVDQVRRVEQTAALAKARLYGAAQARGRSWSQIWDRLTTDIDALTRLETSIVEDLTAHLDPVECERLAAQLAQVEPGSPTRPHPHSPHTGRFAHLTRAWWSRADRVWDAAEGRAAGKHAS